MALGDTLRRIVASDNFILNAAGALVGIKNPNANGLDLRVDTPAAYLPYILAQSAIPAILPSSGSSNATGQITLTTALPYQPSGTVLLYLPAGVVVGDASGGLKSVTFSSTTVCQIVGNPPTANGSYTQTTGSDLTLATITVPGGAMGANGALRYLLKWEFPNNANNHATKQNFGGFGVGLNNNTSVSGGALIEQHLIHNRGAQNQQINGFFGFSQSLGAGGASATRSTIDTSQSVSFLLTGQLTVATDYIILDGYTFEILPSA